MGKSKRPAVIIRPHVGGLDDYMAKTNRLSGLLNEASALYDELKGAKFEVAYEIESATLNNCPHDGHSPSPDEMQTSEPHEGH